MLLHLVVLVLLPGADGARRCPVLFVTLQQAAAEVKAEVSLNSPADATPVQASIELRTTEPKRTRSQSAVGAKPAVTTKPVATRAGNSAQFAPVRSSAPVVTNSPNATATAAPVVTAPTSSSGHVEPNTTESDADSATAASPQANASGTQSGSTATVSQQSVDVGVLKRRYAQAALSKVQRAKFFPESARDPERAGTTVQVRVSFRVSRSGALASVSASGGNAELADAAEDAVRRAAPFGAFPDGLDAAELPLGVTLEYKLY
ncbi:MAG: TonB C-terminal domain-containing protein [bacterium]|nr:TonB C-terminal domain-containing protein [bacterium]